MTTTIMGLMNQIDEGDVVLPAIQRDFVWSEEQTAKLLDSVMRGYPVGIVLMWETYNDLQYRKFVADYRRGSLHTYRENRRKQRLRVVLDGQQRLQSLYIALKGHRDGKELYLDVLSGVEDDELSDERYRFEFLSPEAAAGRNSKREPTEEARSMQCWMPVSDLFAMGVKEKTKAVRALRSDLDLPEDDELRVDQNLSRFSQMFIVNESVLKTATIDENMPRESAERQEEADVLEIFVRINSEGTPLRRSDLIFSMLKLDWKESAEGMPAFVSQINEGNSFDLDVDFVVRCLFAVSGLGGKLDLNLLRNKRNMALLKANFDPCCDAIRAAIDFVHTEGKCQSSRLLGGSRAMVPLVYWLFRLPNHEIPNDQMEAARTGLYLFGLASPFSRYGDSRLGALFRSGDFDSADFPLDDVIGWVQYWERIESLEDLARKNQQLTLHLLQGLSGAKPQYTRNAPEVDHIFPRSELRKKGFDEREINDLANFWILSKGKNRNKSASPPRDYFADVSARQLGAALIDRELLKSYRNYRRFHQKERCSDGRATRQVPPPIGCGPRVGRRRGRCRRRVGLAAECAIAVN